MSEKSFHTQALESFGTLISPARGLYEGPPVRLVFRSLGLTINVRALQSMASDRTIHRYALFSRGTTFPPAERPQR